MIDAVLYFCTVITRMYTYTDTRVSVSRKAWGGGVVTKHVPRTVQSETQQLGKQMPPFYFYNSPTAKTTF